MIDDTDPLYVFCDAMFYTFAACMILCALASVFIYIYRTVTT